MPTQTEAGKAFEFAVLDELYTILSISQNVSIIKNSSFKKAEASYNIFNETEKVKYRLASKVGIQHLLELEPRLENPTSRTDNLELEILPDKQGIHGDVRDVLAIRRKYNWEIGISAKNHHRAVKHSRLSRTIDFGEKWIGINCSKTYFNEVSPIFNDLVSLQKQKILWRNIKDKHKTIYVPILNAFKDELVRIDKKNPSIVPGRLLKYLIGYKDFYKIIKEKKSTTLQGFNMNGTLNETANEIKPRAKVSKLKLPTRIIEIDFKQRHENTLLLICDEGWQISFRIHSASSKVESSLKFDINLEGHPHSLYTHHIHW